MHIRRLSRLFVVGLPFVGAAAFVVLVAGADGPAAPGDPLIAGFKSTYPASVSDAVEIVTGKNGTMRYDMKLMTGTNLVGRAVTSLARPAPAGAGHAGAGHQALGRDDRRREARRGRASSSWKARWTSPRWAI